MFARTLQRAAIVVLLLMVVAARSSALPAQRQNREPCPVADASKAETDVATLRDWRAVYESFVRYGRCDDGAIAEGYSETVGRLLTKDWQHFGDLLQWTRRSKAFELFVVRHVDATIADETLREIARNAEVQCPSNARRLCRLIARAAKAG